jgi:sulfide:quinone oxidoreductase
MARLIQLEKDVFVAPQLVEADFVEIAARGFRSVVNNRPDGEAEGQLPDRRAAAAARRHGLEYRFQPVMNVNVTDDTVVEAFVELLDELPRPILFYCRTGTRCSILWAQAAAPRLGVEQTLEIVGKAGYDLEPLREQLVERQDRVAARDSLAADAGVQALHPNA